MAKNFSRGTGVATFTFLALLGVSVPVGSVNVAQQRSAPDARRRPLKDLLAQYRQGDADAAVVEFARWDPEHVESSAGVLETLNDVWARAALALLHMEAGLKNDTFGTIVPGIRVINGTLDEREVHFRTGARLVEQLADTAETNANQRLLTFCMRWYSVALPWYGPLRLGERRLSAALAPFANKPEVQFLMALRDEHYMGPDICCTGPVSFVAGSLDSREALRATSHGRFAPRNAEEAVTLLRRVLVLEATLIEARVHLGRVLYLLDRSTEAKEELRRALRDSDAAQDELNGYLAAIFLGRLHEDARELSEAEASYRKAILLYPAGQTAYLSLGRLLIRSGQSEQGWEMARQVFIHNPEDTERAVDPWYSYPLDRVPWRQEKRIRELRGMVRQ